MADLEKVIKGLECCLTDDDGYYLCEKCPYAATDEDRTHVDWSCHKTELRMDALELLKAQEADIKALCEKYAELLDRTMEAVSPEKRELPYGMYDAMKYEYKCGACGCGLMRNEKWRANYCPECGRKVKWE